jgi:hypothetical protein
MKVSELIKTLQVMQNDYGDLLVNLCIGMPPDKPNINTTNIYLRYEQYRDDGDIKAHDEISISDFPY